MRDGEVRRRGLLLALGTAVVSGVAVFVNGYGVKAVMDATVYTTAKNLVAAMILVLVAAVGQRVRSRTVRRPATMSRFRWLGLVAVAVVGGSIPFVLFFEGLARASSTHAAFVHKTLVVWVVVLAVPFLGERLRPVHYAAITALVVGQVLLDGGLSGFAFGMGELLLLGATLMWAVEVIVVKRLLIGIAPDVLAVGRMGLGSLVLVAWVAATGRLGDLVGLGLEGWGWAALTGLLLAGYVGTWYRALAAAPAVDVTALLVLAAVLTGVLNAIAAGTMISPAAAAGMAVLLVAGAAIAASWRRPVLTAAS